MKPSIDDLLKIYRAALARYVAEGDRERERIERLLIARLEKKQKRKNLNAEIENSTTKKSAA